MTLRSPFLFFVIMLCWFNQPTLATERTNGVRLVQFLLASEGYLSNTNDVDGYYGTKTDKALQAYQSTHHFECSDSRIFDRQLYAALSTLLTQIYSATDDTYLKSSISQTLSYYKNSELIPSPTWIAKRFPPLESTYKPTSLFKPLIAENGSYYGQTCDNTGLPKTIYVSGYYRADGTYVRSYYRSKSSGDPTYASPYISHTPTHPLTAENGSYYGEISKTTGNPKTVHVNGYYRKDGTYVRGHYRSKGK